jgi:hypothetical protein
MSEGFFGSGAERLADHFSLVPQDFSGGTDVPFIDLLLVELGYDQYCGLSADPAVRSFVHSQPGIYEQIRAVGAVAGRAGVRVRDSGQLKSSFDDNLKYYTPDEIWCFDLAIDVLAMLAVVPGVSGSARFRALDALRNLNATCHGHSWHKQVRHAVDAPAAFGELRSRVPVRTSHQARPASGPGYM